MTSIRPLSPTGGPCYAVDDDRDMSGFLRNAWDLHTHASPDIVDRACDAFELAAACRRAGMRGVVLKSHLGSTAMAARLVAGSAKNLKVLGSVTLNAFVGGLNPAAVEAALRLGAAVVWLPTVHAAHHLKRIGKSPYGPHAGISILAGNGRLKGEVHEIAELVAKRGAALGTGHSSPREIMRLHKELRARLPRLKLFVTHVLYSTPDLSPIELSRLADRRTWLELAYHSVSPASGVAPPRRAAAAIKALPKARWVLTSDAGQKNNPLPPRALEAFARLLRREGIPAEKLSRMVTTSPAALVGER